MLRGSFPLDTGKDPTSDGKVIGEIIGHLPGSGQGVVASERVRQF